MKKLFSFTFLLLIAALVFASPAKAQPLGNGAGRFGAPGSIAISGELEGHLHSGWELHLQPAFDYFIATNVSVGGLIGFTHDSGNPARNAFDIGVRAGYNLAISEPVTFWPTAGIFIHREFGTAGSTSASLNIFAPFLFHLVPHLFVGLGPDFELPLNGGSTGYGVKTVVGGWF
jgi:hypothetical protein